MMSLFSFILMTSLYNEVVPERQEEYFECLERNLAHPNIEKIHVFYDDSRDGEGSNAILPYLRERGVEITTIHKRPSYSDMFKCVNSHYPDKGIIVANADIYFDETLRLLEDFDFTNRIISLSRWEEQRDRSLSPLPSTFEGQPTPYAQDTWIFRSPIRNFDTFNIELGTAYCDGYFNYFAFMNGYLLCNPCYSVISHHLHTSNLRHWVLTERRFPLQAVPWCTLDNIVYPVEGGIISPPKKKPKRPMLLLSLPIK